MNERMRLWGRNIKARREALKLSQAEFAELLGVTQATVSRWEKGLIAPRDEMRSKIAGALHQDVILLFPAMRTES